MDKCLKHKKQGLCVELLSFRFIDCKPWPVHFVLSLPERLRKGFCVSSHQHLHGIRRGIFKRVTEKRFKSLTKPPTAVYECSVPYDLWCFMSLWWGWVYLARSGFLLPYVLLSTSHCATTISHPSEV